MPFSAKDAFRHTHKATTRSLAALWAKIANKERKRIGDARAIRAANAAIARQRGRRNVI